jgi:lysophospholipase L1-like esterase
MPDPAPMLAHFDRHFRRALQRARAHADRVIVVRQPWFDTPCTAQELALMWHGGAGQAWHEDVSSFYSIEVLSTLMTGVNAEAAAIARELDVEQLDLMPVLKGSLATYYDFFHVTPAGAEIVADAVAAAILRMPFSVSEAIPELTAALPAAEMALLRQKVS